MQKASLSDAGVILDMQVRAFRELLEKYQDYATNPAAETVEKITGRMEAENSCYYFLVHGGEAVGFMRVQDFGTSCRVSPIAVLPGHQGRDYAQQAMGLAESLYPQAGRWELDTIQEEPKLCHLYEKLGYRQTGKSAPIQSGMTIVYYEKIITNAKG